MGGHGLLRAPEAAPGAHHPARRRPHCPPALVEVLVGRGEHAAQIGLRDNEFADGVLILG